jgi:hypothetical protein
MPSGLPAKIRCKGRRKNAIGKGAPLARDMTDEPRAAEPAPAVAAQLEALKKWAAELQADLERLRERIHGPAAGLRAHAGFSK